MDQLSFCFDTFPPESFATDSQTTGPARSDNCPLSEEQAAPSTPALTTQSNTCAASARKLSKPAIPPKVGNTDEAAGIAPPPKPTIPELPAAQNWTGELPSFTDALAFIDAAPGLKSTKRRDYRSALISAAKILGQQPRDIRLDLKALSTTPLAKIPKLREGKVKRRRNILSYINKVAVLMGLSHPHRPGPDGLLPGWLDLKRHLVNDHESPILSRLARFCSDRAIEPAGVTSAVFSAFSDDLAASAILSERTAYFRNVANLWTRLITRYPDLGLQPVTLSGQKQRLTLPDETFLASFLEELHRLKAALSPVNLGAMHDDLALPTEERPFRPSQPLKPSTVALRIDQLRYAASALVHSGHDPQTIIGLRDLFTPDERIRTIVRHLRDRSGKKKSSFLAGVIDALRHAARFCQADEATHAELARLRDVVAPTRDGVVPKNRERLRAMIEPNTRVIIMALPQMLLEDAEKCADPLDAARRVRVAVALELLTVAAPRLSNLNLLHLDRSLRRTTNGKCQISHVVVDETEVKNGMPIERFLPTETVELIELWLVKYRNKLAKPGNPWLFPGQAQKPMNKANLRMWITRAIRDYAKVEVHPHLFRHFCAWLHLQYHPGDYEGVRRLLGHKRLETTIESYVMFEQEVAAARHDKVVLKERQVAKRVARQMLEGFRPGKAIKGQTKEVHHAKKS
jgi:site-specific recombinase XerD